MLILLLSTTYFLCVMLYVSHLLVQFTRKFEEDMKCMTLSQFEVYLKSLSIIHIEVQLLVADTYFSTDASIIYVYYCIGTHYTPACAEVFGRIPIQTVQCCQPPQQRLLSITADFLL